MSLNNVDFSDDCGCNACNDCNDSNFGPAGGGEGPTPGQDGPNGGISIPPVDLDNSDIVLGDSVLNNPINKEVTIGGYVKDEAGTPLPNVSVYEGGNDTNGVATDINGFFTLKVKKSSTVYVSHTGTTTEAFLASEFPDLVILKSESLDEVILNVPRKVNYMGWGLGIGLFILGLRIFREDKPKKKSKKTKVKKNRTVKATI